MRKDANQQGAGPTPGTCQDGIWTMVLPSIFLICVTYGKRWKLLSRAIESALREGVARVVVVDNNSADSVSERIKSDFGSSVTVIGLSQNTGSASGYRIGMQFAYENGAEYVMLLDDDNEIGKGAVRELLNLHYELSGRVGRNLVAVVGFRPDHRRDAESAARTVGVAADPNAFFGFSALDIPSKVWRHIVPGRRKGGRNHATAVVQRVETAPYGGLLFHRSLIDQVEYPDARFVLYADDTEYTYRIATKGGEVWLCPKAVIHDHERSWNLKDRFRNSFEQWLCGGDDFRAFYAARNEAYFEAHCRPHNARVRAINRFCYLLGLRLFAWRQGRRDRLLLLLDAIEAGEARRLGIDPRFAL